jgi:hypothetical protein
MVHATGNQAIQFYGQGRVANRNSRTIRADKGQEALFLTTKKGAFMAP